MKDNSNPLPQPEFANLRPNSVSGRKRLNRSFMILCWMVTLAALSMLAVLLVAITVQALPIFSARPDRLESKLWVRLIQGENPGNRPDVVDDGDLLQGVFIAHKLYVGGLDEAADQIFDASQTRVGIFSFELQSIPDQPLMFECQPASGAGSILSILQAAGIELPGQSSTGIDPQSATIALFDVAQGSLQLNSLDGSKGLMGDPELAGLTRGDASLQCTLLLGVDDQDDFSQVKWDFSVSKPVAQDGKETAISVAAIENAPHKKRIGSLVGLYSVIRHDADLQGIVNVSNRSLTSDEIVKGQVALTAGHGRLLGIATRERRGFQVGGTANFTYNFLPEQGTAREHLLAFLQQTPRTDPGESGIGPALQGTLWVCAGCALFALPLGIGTAICLEEFQPKNRWLSWLHGLIQLNISNLAGVPSIVYGIVGLTAFGTMFGLFGSAKEPKFSIGATHFYQYVSEGGRALKVPVPTNSQSGDDGPELFSGMDVLLGDEWTTLNVLLLDEPVPEDTELLARTVYQDAEGGPLSRKSWYYFQLPLGRGVLAASLTLMLVILPVIIIASQEALRSVPPTLRQGALGLGSTRWQSIWHVTLPAAIPGIMTGAILAMSRAIGEAAPIIVLCGIVYMTTGPQHLMDSYSVLPVQLFHWAGQPIDQTAAINWQHVVSAGILVLLAILFTFNALAITIRQWTQKPLS